MDTQRPTLGAVAISSHLTRNNTLHASSDPLSEAIKVLVDLVDKDLVKNNSQHMAASLVY